MTSRSGGITGRYRQTFQLERSSWNARSKNPRIASDTLSRAECAEGSGQAISRSSAACWMLMPKQLPHRWKS